MTVGKRIKKRRIELGLSVDMIAAKLNKNRATIYRYESDDIENLPITVLEPLAEILQTTPAYLMGWDEEPNNSTNKLKALPYCFMTGLCLRAGPALVHIASP